MGYKNNDNAGDNSGNSRNGYTTKTVISDDNDTIEVQVLRDRNSTFEPVIIPKHEKRTPLFNDQIISMYSFGMSTRDIQRHLQQVYGNDLAVRGGAAWAFLLISRTGELKISSLPAWSRKLRLLHEFLQSKNSHHKKRGGLCRTVLSI